MKLVILAGGFGTRFSEETSSKPKPMIKIGDRPILWHIMKIFLAHGINDVIICLGYKGYIIKEFFHNYALHMSDVTIDMKSRTTEYHRNNAEPWKITLIETGTETMTGGRLKRIAPHLGDQDFFMTYGDGVGDVDITKLLAFHQQQGRIATVTATRPPGRFGMLTLKGDQVKSFQEKPEGDGWINGGFFVLSPKVIETIKDDNTMWEDAPLKTLTAQGQLSVFRHDGFWQPMDTLRDRNSLEKLWASGNPPWKNW